MLLKRPLQCVMQAYTSRYVNVPAIAMEDREIQLCCAADVVVLRKAMSFYTPSLREFEGIVDDVDSVHIHCGSTSDMGMHVVKPETGHSTKAFGYSGMTADACPHTEKIKAQGDYSLCASLCRKWRSSVEFQELHAYIMMARTTPRHGW